jgi:hypothetical protein
VKLARDDANPRWIATQGLWYGLGPTRLLAVRNCLVTCVEALSLGLAHPCGGRRYELRRWWSDVFRVGDG